MKIIVIGATGTIGTAVADALEAKHEVVRASRRGDMRVDVGDPQSISALFASVSNIDAVVCCAANVELIPLASLSDDDLAFGLKSKLLGQVNLVRRALGHLRDSGSITVTGGTLADPTPGSAIGALVNAGLEGFVRSAALDMPRGLRVNAVSPGWIKETLDRMGMDSAGTATARNVARAYMEAVEGTMQGQTITPKAL